MDNFNEPGMSRQITESERQFMFDWQLENCARIKGTEVQKFTCVDSTGKITRKVVIEFDD
jgi:hypothetical protein